MAPKRKARKPTGRRTRWTRELQARICESIRAGVPREQAATENGICAATLFGWLAKGRDGQPPYVEFLEAVCKADDALHSHAARTMVSALDECHEIQHRINAAKFMLSHRWPGTWSSRQEVRTTGPDGGPVQVALTGKVELVFSDDQLAQMTPEQLAAVAGE